jgi:hypothetical protein
MVKYSLQAFRIKTEHWIPYQNINESAADFKMCSSAYRNSHYLYRENSAFLYTGEEHFLNGLLSKTFCITD